MARCEICKREKSTPGVSFHKFPKDVEQLQLWIAHISKENYTPKPGSVLCSKHFAPECLEQKFNCVRLKKGSVPTLFTEENNESSIDRPLLDENVIMQHQHEATTITETVIESHDCYSPKESPKIHAPEKVSSTKSSKSIRLHTYFTEIVKRDHNYSNTPSTPEGKLRALHDSLRITRKSNRVLTQKVKRLQKTISSLKDVIQKLKGNLISQEALLKL